MLVFCWLHQEDNNFLVADRVLLILSWPNDLRVVKDHRVLAVILDTFCKIGWRKWPHSLPDNDFFWIEYNGNQYIQMNFHQLLLIGNVWFLGAHQGNLTYLSFSKFFLLLLLLFCSSLSTKLFLEICCNIDITIIDFDFVMKRNQQEPDMTEIFLIPVCQHKVTVLQRENGSATRRCRIVTWCLLLLLLLLLSSSSLLSNLNPNLMFRETINTIELWYVAWLHLTCWGITFPGPKKVTFCGSVLLCLCLFSWCLPLVHDFWYINIEWFCSCYWDNHIQDCILVVWPIL